MSERNDEVGDLIAMLKRVAPRRRDEDYDDDDAVTLPIQVVHFIIEALERVPRPRGNPRAIRGRDKVISESWAGIKVRARKQELIDKGESATQAELQAAEEGVAIFLKQTGRKLRSGTIRRILQGKRSKRPRKSRR